MKTKRNRMAALVCMSLWASGVWAQSLFDEQRYQSLASDHRAFRPGDNLTVLIVETASTTAAANTSTNKSGSLNASVTSDKGVEAAGGLELSEDFNGGGQIRRSQNMLAQITVRVVGVAPNGNMLVKGEQLIEVNNEKQEISVEGQVRPEDVSPNNTVLSSRLSDARITYVGKGVLGEKQRPGILWRFLDWLGIL